MEPSGEAPRVSHVGLRRTQLDEEDFRRFASSSTARMGRFAYLLCGDSHLAQDLVQTCLIKLYQAWPRIRQPTTMDGYVRKVLLRCWLDEQRRPWRRSESRDGEVPDIADASSDPAMYVGADETIRAALAALPPKQRAVVVLRFCEQLSIAETAQVLGCTEGTVKSRTSRGLDALRAGMPRERTEL